MRLHVALAALVGGFVIALLVGCGVNTKDAGKPNPNVRTSTTDTTPTINEDAAKDLPKRADGVVGVHAPVQGSITGQVTGVDGVRVNIERGDDSSGFRALCEGEIDVLDVSRRITPAEERVCNRNGVVLADPLQVASDAVVIATPNESDVGGDCLRIGTVKDIFEAGSSINNWNQVGFFNIPLRVTGGEAQSPAVQFFAQLVFGVDNAALDTFRNDYILRTTDDRVRFEVTSKTRLDDVRRRYRSRLRDLEDERAIEFQLAINRAIDRARARKLAEFAAEDRERAASQITLNEFQKALIERRNRREINAAIRVAQERAIARFRFPRLRFLRERYRNELRKARRRGTIGIFRFSYYELYEQQLRPMEIWDPVRAAASLDAMNGVNVEGIPTTTTTTTTPTTTTTTTTSTSTSTTTTATSTTTSTTPEVQTAEDGDVVVDAARTPWCVFPSQQTITNGSYPLSRPYLLYVSRLNLEREEVQAFLRRYLETARALARANRLVPIGSSVAQRNADIIDLDETPGVVDPEDGQTTTVTTETTTTELPGLGEGTQTSTTTTPTTSTPTTTTATTP
jgi:ABC-type phosphate transport system substrate-binding protein